MLGAHTSSCLATELLLKLKTKPPSLAVPSSQVIQLWVHIMRMPLLPHVLQGVC
jgi:hypothetical protein